MSTIEALIAKIRARVAEISKTALFKPGDVVRLKRKHNFGRYGSKPRDVMRVTGIHDLTFEGKAQYYVATPTSKTSKRTWIVAECEILEKIK